MGSRTLDDESRRHLYSKYCKRLCSTCWNSLGLLCDRVVSYFIIFPSISFPFFCWVVVVICQRVCLGRNDAPWQNTHIKNWVGGGATTTAFIFFFSSSSSASPFIRNHNVSYSSSFSLSLPTASRAILIDFCAFTMSPCARSGSAPPCCCCCCWQCFTLVSFLSLSVPHTHTHSSFSFFWGGLIIYDMFYKHFIRRRPVMDSRINRPPWPTIRFSGSSPLEPTGAIRM